MKRLKISLIMFSLTQKRRKSIDSENTVDVKSVMKLIHIDITTIHGAFHATLVISAETLTSGHRGIKKLIILFKILKHMHGMIS